ncbi:MAG: hypothetical protein IJ019_00330 [Alphaproteobacteria bacterium]|nr:hypothetical protein [Alphaproteobacteria bacterium]
MNVYANQVQIYANACERILSGESKSTVRLRAIDKATFSAIKNLEQIQSEIKNMSDHNFNVMVYRLVDEYVQDLAVNSTDNKDSEVCVEIRANILSENIESVKNEFVNENQSADDTKQQKVAEVIRQAQEEIKIKPDNPENLALVCVKNLEYFNGKKSVKYANLLKKHIDGNPYFYLTEDEQVADYVITPKVLKAKVDSLDAANKRLHMALVLEISGLEKEIVSEYQNRFVLFGAEENEQKTAARLISKLIEQAGDGAVRKIEHKQQQKLETKALGRTLS